MALAVARLTEPTRGGPEDNPRSHNLHLRGKSAVTTSSEALPAAQSQTSGAQRKRPRTTSMSSGDSSKKPRGRPRIEPDDETAAERRRTQIRLAQRAYRLRKETTIASLKEQNDALRTTINRMHSAFKTFYVQARTLGVADFSPDLAGELADARTLFDSLLESAAADPPDELFDIPQQPQKGGSKSSKAPDVASPEKEMHDSQNGSPASTTLGSDVSMAAPQSIDSMPWEQPLTEAWFGGFGAGNDTASSTADTAAGFEPTDWFSPVAVSSTGTSASGDAATVYSAPRPQHADAPPHMNLNAFAFAQQQGLRLTKALPLPRTGTRDESTFARRLHRASIEKGLHLLQHHIMHPSVFRRKFQICLPYGGVVQICHKLSNILNRELGESLEWHEHPVRHLGGAGLHFTRNAAATAAADLNGALDPQLLAALMNTAEEENTGGRVVDITGYEGEWFDPEDVNSYLESKGIRIPGSGETVVLTLPPKPKPAPAPALQDKASTWQQLDFLRLHGGNAHGGTADGFMMANTGYNWSNDSSSSNNNNNSFDFSPAAGAAPITSQPNSSRAASADATPARRLTMDIGKFVKELVKRGACIGRTPGYRKRDIDRAFSLAVSSRA